MSDDSDPDYIPDESTGSETSSSEDNYVNNKKRIERDDEENEEDDEEDEDEEDDRDHKANNSDKIMLIINSNNSNPFTPILSNMIQQNKRRQKSSKNQRPSKKQKYDDLLKKYNKFEKEHFGKMPEAEKAEIYNMEKTLDAVGFNTPEPLRFRFLKLNIANTVKNIIISKLEQLNRMVPCSGEYFKLSNWINILSTIPIGKYHTLPIKNTDSDIASYLQNIKKSIDNNIFGHNETKEQIIKILAQWISNPKSNGYVIGIQGSPGVGKTKLIKEGICKAMEYPFAFISLGGISDASYLNGHHYTYEGATHGKIIECLIKSRVMNPVFLFDELDKVSATSRGEEIINTLIHITDPVQNDKFCDKYFEEIDLDLSKSLIIFTYNDENAINPILRDRMISIKVSGYNSKEKLTICKDYILPELLVQYNMKKGDIVFEDALLKTIIETHGKEEGVRNLKRMINDIISWINMIKYIPTDGIQVSLPFTVTTEFYNKYCRKSDCSQPAKYLSMYI